MKNKLINFFATLLLAAIFSLFLPWWSIMLAAFLSALFAPLNKMAVFLVPFLALLFYWALYSFILSSGNDFILAKKISELLQLGGNPYVLLLVTGIIGGLAGGIAAVFGNQLLQNGRIGMFNRQ